MIHQVWQWLVDGANWHGDAGIPARVVEHLGYTVATLVIAAVLALPAGAWIGHTGRGRWLVTVANALRAVPSLGLLYVVALWAAGQIASTAAYTDASIIVLVILAVPPLLAGAYSGVTEVDPAARDAARGMGMTGWSVLRSVELPCALPLIFSGLRSATLQVIATATIAASVGVGGLGRYLIDGLAQRNYPMMAGGAIIVAVLALVADLLIAAVQRVVVSPGLTGRSAGAVKAARTPHAFAARSDASGGTSPAIRTSRPPASVAAGHTNTEGRVP